MDSRELTDICKCGETSKVQFKELFTSQKQVAEEMIAFANSKGGIIVFGVKDKTGTIVGMDYDMIQTTSREVANAANEQVRPTIYIQTEVVSADDNKCLVVTIAEGKNKPYKDLAGNIWVKQGAMYPSAIIREEENHFVVVLPRQSQGNEGENRENEGAIHNNEGVIAGNDTVNVNSDIVKSASFDGVIEGLKLIAQKSGLEMNAKHVSILKAILSNSKVTVQEISKIIEKSESTVERHIRDMRGIVLDRKGADKNGEWVILGNN